MCLAFNKDISCSMYQIYGTQNQIKFLNIDKLATSTGGSICNALVGAKCIQCVTVIAGHGKLSSFKQTKADQTYQETFGELG